MGLSGSSLASLQLNACESETFFHHRIQIWELFERCSGKAPIYSSV
jgi:hypothetical protein